MSLNLVKATEQVKLTLTKMGVTDIPRDINVSLLLDFSGSMSNQYQDGTVSRILQRLLSIANTIDDDGQLPLTLFHNDAIEYGELSVDQFDQTDQIVADICKKYSMGGTSFAPAVRLALSTVTRKVSIEECIVVSPAVEAKKGFFGFGSSDAKPAVVKTVTTLKDTGEVEGKQLLVLISDGDNSDRSEFDRVIKKIEKMPNVYLQCVCIGYSNSYLEKIADRSDSVGYSTLADFKSSDEALIKSIINIELLEKFSKI